MPAGAPVAQLLSDRPLACRLERAEALAGARFVEARARIAPGSGACWIEVAGTRAMYDGAHSPITQTFGLGLFEMPTAADMEALEAFFNDRGAPVSHEVSPLAGKALLPILSERGYHQVELTSVMFLSLAGVVRVETALDQTLRVRIVGEDDRDLFARTAAEGWREHTEFAGQIASLCRILAHAKNTTAFLVECDSHAIATGSLAIHDGVALLAGASTVPEWRRRGAQRMLLERRLAYAARAGCDIAMFGAEPGSGSQRNAERQGFRIAYTRIKWRLGA